MFECSECNAPIAPVYPEEFESNQPLHALHLSFNGHYGGYFDFLHGLSYKYIEDAPSTALLCEDCVEKVLDAIPNFATKLWDLMK